VISPLLVVGLVVAAFVGYNVGGSTTGPAFGPAVGSGVISKVGAAALMSVFFLVGAWTLGRRVVQTLGTGLSTTPGVFTVETSIVVLFFIGLALFVGNYVGVPASTSMTAVGAIAGLNVAAGTLNWETMGEIVVWWIVAPVLGFWVSGVVGRYLYPTISRWVAVTSSAGPLVVLDRSGAVPHLVAGPNTSRREVAGATVVVSIGCLMAFSSGTSNIANAIAPLFGAGLSMTPLILLGCAAVALGAFTIARRTLDTLGNDITDLPLPAAIVVAVVSSAIVTALSAIGIPASFVIVATMAIVGLGWGRATRSVTVAEGVTGERKPEMSVGVLATAASDDPASDIGDPEDVPAASDLFDPSTTARVVVMQNVVPILSTAGAYLAFRVLFAFAVL
jgi:PiT family inorganic phosphate transporter